MSFSKFLIAPMKNGLQNNMKPWMIADDAYDHLSNVHVWRGRVKKRFGATPMNTTVPDDEAQLFSRLRIKLATQTDPVTGNFNNGGVAIPGNIYEKGQNFSIGDTIFTVYQNAGAMYTTGAATGTFDTATGLINIVGNTENPSTDVYFYPALPVMTLATYGQQSVANELLVGWDTQFAYSFTNTAGWLQLGNGTATGPGVWTGSDSQFYSVVNYIGNTDNVYFLFVVNNNAADQIQYWDGAMWNQITPVYNGADVIQTALIIVPFKNRLLLFNTTETVAAASTTFTNRVRYSQNGSPIEVDAFDETIPGKGGFIDATTKEGITAIEFIKDRLIVFFERSTWELVYTNNEVLPFRFQKLNSDLGVESLNSIIPFDKSVLGFGSTGIHTCNGLNVERIDELIPSEIFDILNNNDGPMRVAGIKDYFTEEVYWSYPSFERSDDASDQKFPNRVMVYNYRTGSYASNDDSITAFGYYLNENDIIWDALPETWAETEETWTDPTSQSLFRSIVAGNQQGFTFIIENDTAQNAQSLSISDIQVAANEVTLTIYNHNLPEDQQFIFINNVIEDGGGDFDALNGRIFLVNEVVDENNIVILEESGLTPGYAGGGTVTLVSQIAFNSKQYNFFNEIGKRIHVPRIDFLFDRTTYGEIQFDYFGSFSDRSLVNDSELNNSATGNFILETFPITNFEGSQQMLWRTLYPMMEGETVQYELAMSEAQMLDERVAFSPFELHAVLFYAQPTATFSN